VTSGAPAGGVTIRQATAADRPFVESASVEAFAHFGPYGEILPPLLDERGVQTLVAESDGQPIGFAMLRRGPLAELVAIAVTGAWRRRGVGRLLLAAAERLALEAPRPARRLWLTCAEDNRAARRLFERAGWSVAPGARGTYPAGQPSLEMWKQPR
jgi:GNAT superfamily N-acetyltransferase